MKPAFFLTLLLTAAWLGISWYWYVCGVKGLCQGDASAALAPETDVTATYAGPLAFRWEDANPIAGPRFEAYRDSIVRALEPGEVLTITGLYLEGEAPGAGAEALGRERARRVAALFAAQLDTSRLRLGTGPAQAPPDAQQQLFAAATFGEDEDGAAMPAARLSADETGLSRSAPVAIRFPLASTRIEHRAEVSAYLDTIADELLRTGAQVRIVGHTDNTGIDAYNETLGLRRAQAVRDMLVQRGVSASRIRVDSRGSSAPVASNDTPEGRNQNRRVELTVE
jgi:outer membrane protein OmpA-like peptidoglycan-associated protein